MSLRTWFRLSPANDTIIRSRCAPGKRRPRYRPAVEPLETRELLSGTFFTVNTTADSGAGSLRQAILDANVAPNVGGPDTIAFNIPGVGVHIISPTSGMLNAIVS